jgi:hypothetical protein
MPSFRISGSRISRVPALLAVLAFLSASPRIHGQTNDNTPVAGSPNEAPLRLKTASNLVVVRVVVRHARGKPVENLKKEDFKLFDRGKEQTITQFEVKTPAPPAADAVHAPAGQAAPPPARALPGNL